jgi:hypothetical protein
MHPSLTNELATSHRQELARRAAINRRVGDRSHHFVRKTIGRYFGRGAQAEQQPVSRTELGAQGARAGGGGCPEPAAGIAAARR